eukprot:5299752-Pyramimonas_sp.AAC.1
MSLASGLWLDVLDGGLLGAPRRLLGSAWEAARCLLRERRAVPAAASVAPWAASEASESLEGALHRRRADQGAPGNGGG